MKTSSKWNCAGIGAVLALAWLSSAAGALPGTVESFPGADLGLVSTEGAGQTVYLEYRELAHGMNNGWLSVQTQDQPFRKEPDTGRRKVFRGSLVFGSGAEQSIPFLWDSAAGKLYLDLNRNQDLTDDAAGIFTCARKEYSDSYQRFTNVQFNFPAPDGLHPVLVNLTLNRFGSHPNASTEHRSFWEGKVLLQGREWQLGLIEPLGSNGRGAAKAGSLEGGYLLLRPWRQRGEPFNLSDGSLDGFGFCRNLFLDDRAYRLEYAFVREGEKSKYRVTIDERAPDLGELKLTGKFLKRFVLTGSGGKPANSRYTVVLNQPAPVVKVPLGAYDEYRVQLEAGSAGAYREFNQSGFGSRSPALVVTASNTALCSAGGQLTNAVSVGQRGATLALSYKLVGADGAVYQLAKQDRSDPPQFAVYQQGKEIASGQFEFG